MYYEIKYPKTLDETRRQHEQYIEERKRFDANKGILAPIRAVIVDDSDGYYLATGTVIDHLFKAIDYLKSGLDGEKLEQMYWKNVSSIVGYFAAMYSDILKQPVLTYSICAHQDLPKFDNEFGKLLAIHRALTYTAGDSLKNLFGSTVGMANMWLPDAIDVTKLVIFPKTPQQQAQEFAERCCKYYKRDSIPCLL